MLPNKMWRLHIKVVILIKVGGLQPTSCLIRTRKTVGWLKLGRGAEAPQPPASAMPGLSLISLFNI